VFVGVDEEDEALAAEATGWEFLHVEDAADAAGGSSRRTSRTRREAREVVVATTTGRRQPDR